MSVSDPNREQLVRVARALGDFRDEVVFVGGATLGLLVSDPAAPMVRPTDDVDVVVEVASYVDYYASQDLEDIVVVIDGRPEVVDDLSAASEELRIYIAESATDLLGSSAFLNALPGHVEAGRAEIVLRRLREIVDLTVP